MRPVEEASAEVVRIEEQVRALPKAEVHVHLEGSFEAQELARLAGLAGVPLPRPVERLFDFEGLADFLEFLDWGCALVTTADQLTDLAYSFAKRESESGVGYADVIVNPTHWPIWQHRLDDFVGALDAGFTAAEQDGLTPVGLCLSLLRQQSASEAHELVDWMLDRRHPRVVALSIDGNEAAAGPTAHRFAPMFERARAAGLRTTAHAGESSGPEGVRDAIDILRAERIDHGVRASEDADLVAELADRRIPLGVCPTSNVALGLYPNRHAHPIETLRLAGVPVSVNTDDSVYLSDPLAREYARCATTFGWTDAVLRDVLRTSIEACFAPPELQARMLKGLDAAPGDG
jgi:adenosine deaminase